MGRNHRNWNGGSIPAFAFRDWRKLWTKQLINTNWKCLLPELQIWGPYGYVGYCPLTYDAVQCARSLSTLRRNLLPPSSRISVNIILHGIMPKEVAIFNKIRPKWQFSRICSNSVPPECQPGPLPLCYPAQYNTRVVVSLRFVNGTSALNSWSLLFELCMKAVIPEVTTSLVKIPSNQHRRRRTPVYTCVCLPNKFRRNMAVIGTSVAVAPLN